MLTTIDKAGRLVIPKALRDHIGLDAGPVQITVQGSSLILDAPAAALVERDGHLFLPSTGSTVTAEQIRDLRLVDQR
jgi:AbrB family looped-hinge helix DNA binding protein